MHYRLTNTLSHHILRYNDYFPPDNKMIADKIEIMYDGRPYQAIGKRSNIESIAIDFLRNLCCFQLWGLVYTLVEKLMSIFSKQNNVKNIWLILQEIQFN